MVALWMLYATLVTALFAVGAWAADGALALFGRPRRWAWAVAVAGGLALPAWAGWRATHPAPAAVAYAPGGARVARAYVIDAEGGPGPTTRRFTIEAPAPLNPYTAAARAAVVRARAARAVASATRALAPWDRALLAAWLLASAAGAALVVRGEWAVRHRRRGWRAAVVAGERVWLAPDLGPALVGALRPRVVLPTWAVDALGEGELRLVLAHERAHAAARDPLLLAFALGAVVIAPWNAALWLAARRLRLAAEADCDRRVLRAHPGARRYARLLVDVAERALSAGGARGAGALATALLDPPGLLERRVGWLLVAERAAGGRRAPRAAGAVLGAAGVAALACAVPRPAAVAPAPAVLPDIASACVARPSCQDSASESMARAAVRMDSIMRAMSAAAARMKPAAPATLPAMMDSIARASSRVSDAQLASVLAATDSVLKAREAGIVRVQRVADSLDAARFAEIARASLQAVPDSLLRLRGGTQPPVIRGVLSDAKGVPSDAALRTLVRRHFPRALTGGMGPNPVVWFALDTAGRVTNTATGPRGLLSVPLDKDRVPSGDERVERVTGDVAPAGRELVLDGTAARFKFPELGPGRARSVVQTRLDAGHDTVQIILIAAPHPR